MSNVNKPTYGDRSFASGAPAYGDRIRVNQAFPSAIPVQKSKVIRNGRLINITNITQMPSAPPALAPAPPQDTPAGNTSVRVAGMTLSGDRAVTIHSDGKAYYADSSTVADAVRVQGITTGGALAGGNVTVQESGEFTEPSWTWTPGLPLFLGLTGYLTQTPGATGFILVLGAAVTTTTILIRIEQPIILA